MLLTKKCSKCCEYKEYDMFPRLSTAKTGRASHCKACKSQAVKDNFEAVAAQKKAYYEANKEATLAKAKLDRGQNPDKYKAKEAAKYGRNKDKIKSRVSAYQKRVPEVNRRSAKKYRDANPHLCAAKTARRRAYRLRATPKWTDDEFEQFYIAEVYHLAKLRTEMCSECHVDHVVPLVSDIVCGLHCAANLRVLPARENESKGNKYWPDMP